MPPFSGKVGECSEQVEKQDFILKKLTLHRWWRYVDGRKMEMITLGVATVLIIWHR